MRTLPLAGQEIAITGRLASMTREQAVQAITEGGGTYVELPTATTDLLVVGLEGWPLQRDGRLTRSLRRARRLETDGHAIRIVEEPAFLAAAGLSEHASATGTSYTAGQLARILEVSPARIRSWLRKGLIRPTRMVHRLAFFDFAQVSRARTLQHLLEQGVTAEQIRSSLERLRTWLPDASAALGQLDVLERGGPVLVRLDDGTVVEPSGQLRFSFAGDDRVPVNDTAPRPLLPTGAGAGPARDWFLLALQAEDRGDLDTAADAYQNALLADGPRAETNFNLGNVLHGLDRIAEAAQRYLVAVELEPDYVEAWNNLGNALGEIGRFDGAVSAYRRAIEVEPAYADAHFNLAETLHQAGRFDDAARHWQAYLLMAPTTGDRGYVERMLAECLAHKSS